MGSAIKHIWGKTVAIIGQHYKRLHEAMIKKTYSYCWLSQCGSHKKQTATVPWRRCTSFIPNKGGIQRPTHPSTIHFLKSIQASEDSSFEPIHARSHPDGKAAPSELSDKAQIRTDGLSKDTSTSWGMSSDGMSCKGSDNDTSKSREQDSSSMHSGIEGASCKPGDSKDDKEGSCEYWTIKCMGWGSDDMFSKWSLHPIIMTICCYTNWCISWSINIYIYILCCVCRRWDWSAWESRWCTTRIRRKKLLGSASGGCMVHWHVMNVPAIILYCFVNHACW